MRERSRIRARPRCRDWPRRARSRRADYAQAMLPPHERPDVRALARARICRDRRRHRRARPQRGTAAAGRVLVGGRDVGGERRDGEPFDRYRRRPRPFHAGESREPLPPFDRSARDHARAARDLRRRAAFRRARSAARGAAVRRRGGGESHPLRSGTGRSRASSSSSTAAPPTTPRRRAPRKWPARQTREASAAIARRHGLDPAGTVFAQQSPEAIDAGSLSQRRDRRRLRHDAALPRARLGARRTRVLDELREARRRRLHADRRSRRRREPRRRRRKLSLQQPAPAAHRRHAAARRPCRVPRERPRGRVSRHAARRRRTDRGAASRSTCGRACATAAAPRACGSPWS